MPSTLSLQSLPDREAPSRDRDRERVTRGRESMAASDHAWGIHEARPSTPLLDGSNRGKSYNAITPPYEADANDSVAITVIDHPPSAPLSPTSPTNRDLSAHYPVVSEPRRSTSPPQRSPRGPSTLIVVFKEPWKTKEARYRKLSPLGDTQGWRLMAVIVKSGDDLRQEQCAAQLIHLMSHILYAHCPNRDYWYTNIIPTNPLIYLSYYCLLHLVFSLGCVPTTSSPSPPTVDSSKRCLTPYH